MARYIDADALTAYIKEKHCDKCEQKHRCFYCTVDDALMLLEEADDADVVEVVRCKDCRSWEEVGVDPVTSYRFGYCQHYQWQDVEGWEKETNGNDFCSYGERKETIAYTKEKHSKKEDVCGITHLPCCYCQPVCGSKKDN
jgi:hypothetical protein